MNKECTYINDTVIVRDESGNQNQVDYYDNIYNVLVLENIIEIIENEINKLENEMENNKLNKRRYIPISPATMSTTVLAISGLSYLDNPSLFIEQVNISIKNLVLYNLKNIFYLLPLLIGCEAARYCAYKRKINNQNGISYKLDFLKIKRDKLKKSLEILKSDKKRNNENIEFKTEKINDSEELKQLRKTLDIYYDLGYNYPMFYKCYSEGILEEVLNKRYPGMETEVKCAKKYFKDQIYAQHKS